MPTTATDTGQEQPKVSIVVPTCNTGETVLVGLRSFLAQTMPRSEFEIIYVDDGSSDDTVALLEEEIARQGAQQTARVLRTEHSGWPGRPRNIGTDAARGRYIHYVDDDDWLAPEALERTYARARETGADIVIGRMAGHGRQAPRALFEKPMTSCDLRTDTTLLASMTVHKLFRRAFLQAHRLRFPEGKVRLEDHMFTLRAFLLTDRVATVHDYTCYHWVRHDDGKHNISYSEIEPDSYVASIRKVLAILDAPETRVPAGRHRHRLAARWYGKKALDRISGKRLLDQPAERRAAWARAVGALAAEMPEKADAALPTRLRIVAALARHGDLALLEELAAFEAGIGHRPRVESARWQDGRLHVRCETSLVRERGRGRGAAPLVFSRADPRRLMLRLPPAVAAVPRAAETADFAKAVQRSNVRAQLRNREDGTVLNLPATWRVVEEPVGAGAGAGGAGGAGGRDRTAPGGAGDGQGRAAAGGAGDGQDQAAAGGAGDGQGRAAAGGASGGQGRAAAGEAGRQGRRAGDDGSGNGRRGLARRLRHRLRRLLGRSTADTDQQLRTLRYEAEFSVDPATADHGRPLAPGTWDLRFQLGVGGWRTARPLTGQTLRVPDRPGAPHLEEPDIPHRREPAEAAARS
ncbi:glycosyltransferase family 2 protein [Streptomyces albus]